MALINWDGYWYPNGSHFSFDTDTSAVAPNGNTSSWSWKKEHSIGGGLDESDIYWLMD